MPKLAAPRIHVFVEADDVSPAALACAVIVRFRPPVFAVNTVIARADEQLPEPHENDQADSLNVTSGKFAASETFAVTNGPAVAVTVIE